MNHENAWRKVRAVLHANSRNPGRVFVYSWVYCRKVVVIQMLNEQTETVLTGCAARLDEYGRRLMDNESLPTGGVETTEYLERSGANFDRNLDSRSPFVFPDLASAEPTREIVRSPDALGELPPRIPSETLKRLSVLNPCITFAHIIAEWLVILGSIALCWRLWNPIAYVLCVFWIGARQHALGVLMHEGSHYRIVNKKTWSDWVSDIFLAWPILITTAAYRTNHLGHHKYTNTEKDPDCERKLFQMNRQDWEFPITRLRLALTLLKDLTSVSAFTMIKILFTMSVKNASSAKTRTSPVPARARFLFYLTILTSSIAFGFWKPLLLLWFVPYLTTFNLLLHIRSVAEHFATENENALNITRTTIAPWWERAFFPKNINFHIEHHLYPSVPFYRLRELHGILMEQPAYKNQAHITQSYFGVLRECLIVSGFKKTCLPQQAIQSKT